MKCPVCGQWNRSSMPHCFQCGTPLNIDGASRQAWKDSLQDDRRPAAYLRADEFGQVSDQPDSRDALAREMQDLKKRKQEGAELLQRLRENTAERPYSGIEVEEPEEASPEEPSVRRHITMRRVSDEADAARRESETRHRVRFMDDTGAFVEARTYDPISPGGLPLDAYSHSFSARMPRVPLTLPARMRRRKILRGIVLILLLAAVVGVSGVFAWRHFFSSGATVGDTSRAIVTASMTGEVGAHTILIPGEDGTSIYIRELHASYTVSEGYASVEVPDHTWYDNLEGELNETMDVTLTPFIKTASGRQLPMDPISYTINIPLSPVKLLSPDSLRTTVSTQMSAIKLEVRPGSRVTVNGNDISDMVSSDTGEMSYSATVQPIGDNTFTFVVRSQYCRDNTITVVLYREKQDIPLDLAVSTFGSTDEDVMKVSATTLPGAYVEVTTPHSDLDITDLDSTGKFSFNALFTKIGDNTITIIASYPGRKPSRVDHTVYYLPPADKYTVKAWPMDEFNYNELLSNMTVRAERCQVYVITGVVQRLLSEKPQQAVINTSEDGRSRPVVVQNYTKTDWEPGTYYRLYADADSIYSGMPFLNARYTYRK